MIAKRPLTLADLPSPPESVTVWPWTRPVAAVPPLAPSGRPWPRISIVIPSLQQAAFIEQAIRSVLLQGYPNAELIVMDGGSTDGTVQILERYDEWLRHWESRTDAGPADALNRGFVRASGEVFGFLNADDFYLPGCLEQIGMAFDAAESCDVVSGHGYFARPSGAIGAPAFSDPWHWRRFCYGACLLLQPATFFRERAFVAAGGVPQTGSVCWDMELWAEMARRGARFRLIDAFVAAFRIHPGSISGRAAFAQRRRLDARQVMARMRGRPETAADRMLHLAHRAGKFSRHPLRTIAQRLFFFETLRRWSL